MARPREFDMETALHGAMQIFWRHGYKATNLPDLLTAMGLTRGSFYKAFDDKLATYLAALDQYDKEVIQQGSAALRGCAGPDPLTCLALLFDAPKDPKLGCFICNAMVEMAPFEPEVARRTRAMAETLRAAIQSVLDRTGVQGDTAQMADVVLHLYFGDQAMGRSGGARGDWRAALQRLLG